jgi:two-component system sensor histidine kinase UhpB
VDAHAQATGYATGVADRVEPGARRGGRLARTVERLASRPRRTSLYARVVAINGAIVAGATLVLVLTPATVGYPIQLAEAIVLVVGVALVVVANALVLRISFGALDRLVARMQKVDLLRPPERLPPIGGPETRAVVAGANQMLERLEHQRRESSQRTLAALEGERLRIAQELHDEIGQRLTGMLLQLGNLVPDAPPDLRERVSAIQEDARSTLDEVGQLAWQLRPGILDDLGLLRALEALVESLGEQTPEIGVRCSLPAALPAIAPEVELAIYRVAQEALTNAVRHAGAQRIALAIGVEHGRLVVSVTDDGIGLPGDADEDAGLRGMRERALAIGGTLTIDSHERTGVRVSLELPVPADAS